MALAGLNHAPCNPRKISEKAAAGLRASLNRWGLVQDIVWNSRSGNIVGGHKRHDALVALGETETESEVVVVDLPPVEEKALNVELNSPHVAGESTGGKATREPA